jgi:hypothetical protein
MILAFAVALVAGCAAPPEHVVEREYIYESDGVTRETVVVEDPPPAYVEVYPGPVYVGGYYRYRAWHGGYRR